MKILLCAATEMEIAPTINHLNITQNGAINVLITGIGLMASTYAITKAVDAQAPEFIIQAGIGGSLDNDLLLGTVVAVRSETIGDLGVQERSFRSLFDMNFLNPNAYPWLNKKLPNENKQLFECGLPLADAITVNEISTANERIKHYRTANKAQVESMEGAALHYVGRMEKIAFLQIRSLSNFAGERDKTKWAMQKAVNNLNNKLQQLLHNLTE